jgi:hypothetical protein
MRALVERLITMVATVIPDRPISLFVDLALSCLLIPRSIAGKLITRWRTSRTMETRQDYCLEFKFTGVI